MSESDGPPQNPSGKRLLFAAFIVAVVVGVVWKVIDYRMQPPPPPHKVSAPVTPP